MLVLTRKQDESIVINDTIIVTILAVEGEKVKIGIQAPREVRILREELYQAFVAQNKIVESLVKEPLPHADAFQHLRDLLLSEAPKENGEASAPSPEAPKNPEK